MSKELQIHKASSIYLPHSSLTRSPHQSTPLTHKSTNALHARKHARLNRRDPSNPLPKFHAYASPSLKTRFPQPPTQMQPNKSAKPTTLCNAMPMPVAHALNKKEPPWISSRAVMTCEEKQEEAEQKREEGVEEEGRGRRCIKRRRGYAQRRCLSVYIQDVCVCLS